MVFKTFLAFILFLGIMQPAFAAARVLSVQAYSKAGEELLEIQFSESVQKQKLFMLENPDRVVLDVAKIENSTVRLPADYQGNWMKAVRFGQNSPQTSRFVITLNAAAKSVSAHEFSAEDGKPYRIVVSMSVSDAALKKETLSEAKPEAPRASSSFFSFFSRKPDAPIEVVEEKNEVAQLPVSSALPACAPTVTMCSSTSRRRGWTPRTAGCSPRR